jgi:uncharacterized protein YndB with AHSA1/START domain
MDVTSSRTADLPAPARSDESVADVADGDGAAVRRRIGLDVDRDAAWALVGTSDGLARWLAAEVELDPSVGGALRVVEHDGTVRIGRVREVDVGHRLSFEWTDGDGLTSTVDLTVEDEGDGASRVTVVETAAAGGRMCARLDVGGWDDRAFALEVAGLDRSLLVGPAAGAPTV